MAKRKLGTRAKAKRRVQNTVNRLTKNGYVFNQSFIEKIHNPKTHFEKIDIDKIYSESTKGGVKGTKARAQERSERARRAARTRKERQQNKFKIPNTINIVRDILRGLRTKQYFYMSGLVDVTAYRNGILSIFDSRLESLGAESYSNYLQNVQEQLMVKVNDANNAYYWEEYQSTISDVAVILKGSPLTVEESIKIEPTEDNSPTLYEEEDERLSVDETTDEMTQ